MATATAASIIMDMPKGSEPLTKRRSASTITPPASSRSMTPVIAAAAAFHRAPRVTARKLTA